MTSISPAPRLVRTDGREIPIEKDLIIGRLPECNIQIEDSLISRQHARLEVSGAQVILSDLSSHNGTWVNDKKILLPTTLNEGDRVRIGHSVFIFRAGSIPPVATLVTPPAEPASSPARMEGGTMIWEMAAPLTLVRGDGAEYGLNSDSKLGRDPANNIVLDKDTSASQFHARLDLDKGRIFVTDLGSANGTWLNGKRVTTPTLLKHGDRIRIGNTIFRLKVGDAPLPPLEPTSPSAPDVKKSVRTSVGVSLGVTVLIIFCVGMIALAAWGLPKLLAPEPTRAPTLRATNTLLIIPGGPGSDATSRFPTATPNPPAWLAPDPVASSARMATFSPITMSSRRISASFMSV
jgi:pSer/pThr/pTyr-binding forkhead associated (FHA) protein